MARKLEQIIARGASTWLVRVYLGRNSPEKAEVQTVISDAI